VNSATTESDPQEKHIPIVFSGKGGEYFGIWIVNLLLTIITLGIYSAWAKVRRLHYFYRNTALDGSSFDYHGRPTAILKGRVIAFAMLLIYNLAGGFDPMLGLAVGAVFACVLPWLLLRSLQFKLHNSSHRGLRFRFSGKLGESYVVFLLLPLVSVFTLYLLAPVWHQQLKRFQHNNSWFGQTSFSFDAPIRAFYKIYLAAAAFVFGGAALGGMLAAVFGRGLVQAAGRTGPEAVAVIVLLIFAGFFLLGLFIRPYLESRLQNLVWNNTRLGPHRFSSNVTARKLFFIMITNLVGIVLTLGLFRPFAVVRTLKYRLESVSMLATGDLDSFAASQEQPVGAVGEEAAEMFDIDIAL
jgi:uncharacterized membrane protein YjgN (DUF898 family)